jgi:hypothetical protein
MQLAFVRASKSEHQLVAATGSGIIQIWHSDGGSIDL